VERYRLLNEPEQAVSICKDVLAVDPQNQEALRGLLLSLTDEFGKKRGATLQDAQKVTGQLSSEYEREYYGGVACERWGRCKLQEGAPAYIAGEWLQKAMRHYESAEKLRPAGDDAAILRWNTCARLIEAMPDLLSASHAHELHLGD
jgi:hypothetical protein